MTFIKFVAQELIDFPTARRFKLWLGSTAKSNLPKSEWLQLWNEFLKEEK